MRSTQAMAIRIAGWASIEMSARMFSL